MEKLLSSGRQKAILGRNGPKNPPSSQETYLDSMEETENLVKLGIDPERAWKSSVNGRGAWWNSGQSHMNQAIKNDRFVRLGLYSLRFMEIR